MWLAFAFGSALFAGLTSILAKIGIQHTDSNVATAIRTVVVLFFSWLMFFIRVICHTTENFNLFDIIRLINRCELVVLFQSIAKGKRE